jgi:hypothetical protein
MLIGVGGQVANFAAGERQTGRPGPIYASRRQIEEAFAEGCVIESVELSRHDLPSSLSIKRRNVAPRILNKLIDFRIRSSEKHLRDIAGILQLLKESPGRSGHDPKARLLWRLSAGLYEVIHVHLGRP